MSAYLITEDGRGYMLHGRYKTEDGAIRRLLDLVGKSAKSCIEVHLLGAEREPREVTAEWMMANCRELTIW